MTLLVIQSHAEGTLGVLEPAIAARQIAIDVRIPIQGDRLPESSQGYEGLILLGGAMNATDDANHPHLRQGVDLVRQFHAETKPILGICLGAQLIARAFGKPVHAGIAPEVGFCPISIHPEAVDQAPWLKPFSDRIYSMQWHYDTFDLPDGAIHLMSSDRCRNQAFKVGDTVYGLQFHPEVTAEMLQRWSRMEDDYVKAHVPDFAALLAQQATHHLEDAMRFCQALADAWLDRVGDRPNL